MGKIVTNVVKYNNKLVYLRPYICYDNDVSAGLWSCTAEVLHFFTNTCNATTMHSSNQLCPWFTKQFPAFYFTIHNYFRYKRKTRLSSTNYKHAYTTQINVGFYISIHDCTDLMKLKVSILRCVIPVVCRKD